MKTAFVHFLHQQGWVEADIELMVQQAECRTVPARSCLVAQGQHLSHIHWLYSGVGHACYLTEQGKAFSKEFYWEGDWIIGFEPLISGLPAPYQQETLSECQLVSLPVSLLEQWRYAQHPVYVRLVETQLRHKENKERILLLNSPEQRYLYFCQNYPFLIGRLTDYQIAGYLGITPISLSRIIARLKKRQS
ncbi:Crp/Fnr family transcriptional regulator [Bacterioplanes sanyensis]|uniref:Crp/Fnr family transcriptional regulator n=1 Tax=Bacterioplanes sanyensis TaxID=1249553 RepID=A0A222FEC9_9GAMM|nr:Crp/Fnr family transcriptional regulator [Bacterioplanes sanyensis]ASP37445.1 Crp/Fnr family transcriptional regulator [Bacterioplanes sanyensis]